MRYINKFDYIVENVALARAIINSQKLSYENPIFQEILAETKRDGYTGFITKLVFVMDFTKEEAFEIYKKIKENRIDVAVLLKKSAEDIRKLLGVNEDKDYKYLFTIDNYKIYLINNYQGILETGSPAWCLKTKSYFDSYTKTKQGMQFVVIHQKFVTDDNKFLMTVPDDWDGERYESGSYAKMRFGITVYPSSRMDIFDDSNILIEYYGYGSLTNSRYNFLMPVIEKIKQYHRENVKLITADNWEDYDQFKELLFNIFDELHLTSSFSTMYDRKIDENMVRFYTSVEEQLHLNKEQLFTQMSEYRENILSDDEMTQHDGWRDILLNEWLTSIPGTERLESVPNITADEIALGGYLVSELEIYEPVIKYHYGYQYTKYGKACILQGYGSLTDFYKALTVDFIDVLYDGQGLYFPDLFKYNDEEGKTEMIKALTYTKKEDGYEIHMNIKKMLSIFKKDKWTEKLLIKNLIDGINPYFNGTTYIPLTNEVIVPIYSIKTKKS
jgi:hypothetical protein